MHLDLGTRTLDLTAPVVMGILNVTPDSFSDGGRYADAAAAIRHGLEMVGAGAGIIDIGGESTRPGSSGVSDQEQLRRVLPVLRALRDETDAVLSIDTGSAAVMRECHAAGADLINDVFGLTRPGAVEAVADTGAAACIMHMQGAPATMQQGPSYDDVVADVTRFFRSRIDACAAAGIAAGRLILDPGFGFGKTDDHNMRLLGRLDELAALGLPVLVGLSRKGSLGRLTGRAVDERLAAGVAAAVMAVERGARIVRTHDVPETVDALRIVQAARIAAAGTAVNGDD